MTKNEFRRAGNSDGIGNTDNLGKTDRIGKSDRIGSLKIREIKGRRAFFDDIKDYIKNHPKIALSKLEAYYQYTTGASSSLIHQALAVLENLELIRSEDIDLETYYWINEKETSVKQ